MFVALLAVAAFAMRAVPAMIAMLPARLDGLARENRLASVALGLLAGFALSETAMLATFIGDPTFTQGASAFAPTLRYHACSGAYMRAGELAVAGVDNLYAAERWPSLGGTGEFAAAAERYAPFGLDAYAYPPTFLVLIRPFVALRDFSAQRALWFGLNALMLAYGLWTVAAWVGERDPVAGTRVILLSLLLWASPLVLITLQAGNLHVAMVAATAVAMIHFERERRALGGALLSFAILSKISPGLLGIVLLVRRRVREALWTAGGGALLALVALWMFGAAPFSAFLRYELPRLRSGEALAFFAANVSDVTLNLAPFGIPFKLAALGVEIQDPWALGRTIATIFDVVILGFSILAGRRGGPRWARASVWMAVLTLGAIRSPFAPGYVGVSVMWALCLSARELHGLRGVALFVLGYVASMGVPPLPPKAALVFSLVQQGICIGIVLFLIARRGPKEHAEDAPTAISAS